MHYVAFVHDDDLGYGISFPDFPGCISIGDTVCEAVQCGSDALAFHLEGLSADGEPIPRPRPIEAIKDDPGLAAWRRGAEIALVPLLIERDSLQRANDSLDRQRLD